MELITIGLTCYNAQDTIGRALESALAQDWPNCEILVVDDASSDGSRDIIADYQQRHPQLRLICHESNRGYPAALNTIVNQAKGRYVAFFDDDDASAPTRLTAQYERITAYQALHPKAPVVCYSNRRVFVNGIEKPDAAVAAIGRRETAPHGAMVAAFLLWHEQARGHCWGEFGSCTLLAEHTLLQAYLFDTTFRRGAEWDFAIRLALDGGHFIAVDAQLVNQHKTLTADKAGKNPLTYALRLRHKHKTFLRDNHVYLGALCQAYSRYAYFRGHRWASGAYLLLACLFSPAKILKNEWNRRYARQGGEA